MPLFREAYRIWDSRASSEEANSASGTTFGDPFGTLDFLLRAATSYFKAAILRLRNGINGTCTGGHGRKDLLVAFLGAQPPFVVRKWEDDEYVMIGDW
jgi:hypothetical protein